MSRRKHIRKKRDQNRRARALASTKPPLMMHTIYGAPITREVRDQVTIAVNVGGSTRKLFKILFRNASPDLYVALPYLSVNSFRCGLVKTSNEVPYEIAGAIDTHNAQVPVKLSYHESGQVHFKPNSTEVAPKLPLTSVKSIPIANLCGTHIFTLELDGVLSFREAKEKDRKRPGFFAYDVPADVRRVKVTAFAGFARELVSGKHTAANGTLLQPTALLAFRRAQYRVPFYLGLYIQYGPSVQSDLRGAVYELLLGGFTSAKEAGEYVFMHASV